MSVVIKSKHGYLMEIEPKVKGEAYWTPNLISGKIFRNPAEAIALIEGEWPSAPASSFELVSVLEEKYE